MKRILAWVFIFGGAFIGVLGTVYGIKKAKNERARFNLFLFLRKCFRKTPFDEFTGYEIVALAILSFVSAVLIWLIYEGILL